MIEEFWPGLGEGFAYGKSATVRPSGPLRVNNGDAMMPALIAGTGLGVLSEFIVRDAVADGRLERMLPEWFDGIGFGLLGDTARRPAAEACRIRAQSLTSHRRGVQNP
jgi:DNA-binding transcriptional LysR family regulator